MLRGRGQIGPKLVVGLYAVGTATLVAAVTALVRNWVAGEVASSSALLGVLTVLVLIAIVIQLQSMRDSLDRLRSKASLSIKYFEVDTHGIEEIHRQAAKVIRRARPRAEILAVNSYAEVSSYTNDDTGDEPRRNYLDEFKRRFGDLSYHRLIQIPHWSKATKKDKPLSFTLTRSYLDHYRAMIAYRVNGSDGRVKLEEVDAVIPTSFVVVRDGEGGEVIWQIHRHAQREDFPEAMEMHGIFIIRDPEGLIVPHFVKWFQLIDSGEPKLVTEQRLQAAASAQ